MPFSVTVTASQLAAIFPLKKQKKKRLKEHFISHKQCLILKGSRSIKKFQQTYKINQENQPNLVSQSFDYKKISKRT